jgi:hypothetical protein
MKIKCVRKESEIKGGTWYIRAVINCHGEFWVETHKVHGKPFDSKADCFKGQHVRQIRKLGKYAWSKEQYLSDFGLGSAEVFGVRMIPFSSATFNYLSSIKDVRSFADAINNRKVSDEEFLRVVSNWEFQKYMDKEIASMHEDDFDDDYYDRESSDECLDVAP